MMMMSRKRYSSCYPGEVEILAQLSPAEREEKSKFTVTVRH